jgi:hypothetical protein
VPQQRHKIIRKRVALADEESVNGSPSVLCRRQPETTHAHLHHRQ